MKTYLTFFAILVGLAGPACADVTVNLDAGVLAGSLSAPMQVDDTIPSSNGSLLLLIDLGPDDSIDNTLTSGNYVSGADTILAAGGFNENGGNGETLTTLTISSGYAGDDIALRWFPQITYAEYESGAVTLTGDYFGAYAPSSGSNPDGGNVWVLPSSGSTISLDFYTSNSDGGGTQSPDAGEALFQVQGPTSESEVPEPSVISLLIIGSLILLWFIRFRKSRVPELLNHHA